MFGGEDSGGWWQGWVKNRVMDKVERGGMREREGLKEKREGSDEVRETATGMVCIKLVRLNFWEHFWPLMNRISIVWISGLMSLSMV